MSDDTLEQELLFLLAIENSQSMKEHENDWFCGNLRFLLHDAQCVIYDAFHSNDWRDTVVIAARRFGKSTLGFILCLEYCLRNPYQISRFIPPEIKQAWQIVMPTFGKLQRLAPPGLIEHKKAENAFRVGQDSWIFLGGFDSQNDAQRGGEASFIVCDEEGSTNPEEYNYILKSVLKPQLLDTKGRMLHLGTIPPDLSHPFMTETVFKAECEDRYFEFTIHDNPRLDESQKLQAIEDCGGEDTDEYQREYLCKRTRTPHLMVCPKFQRNMVEKLFYLPLYTWFEVIGDWGGVTDKTVILCGWYDTETLEFKIYDEVVSEPHTASTETVEGIRRLIAYKENLKVELEGIPPPHNYGHRGQPLTAWLDVPGQMQVDLNKLHKLNVRVPLKDDLASGIKMLNHYLDKYLIKIHPRCKFLLKSLEEAKFNKKRTDFERTEALGHCDAIAAIIYFLRMARKEYAKPPEPRDYQRKFYNARVQSQNERAAIAIGGRKLQCLK